MRYYMCNVWSMSALGSAHLQNCSWFYLYLRTRKESMQTKEQDKYTFCISYKSWIEAVIFQLVMPLSVASNYNLPSTYVEFL